MDARVSADAATGEDTDDAGSSDGAAARAGCGEGILDANGDVIAAEYRRQAALWDRATIDCRLGPKLADLQTGSPAPRPMAYEPEHRPASNGYLCGSYELGTEGTDCGGSCDYGSTSGQVLYAPDSAAAIGVERVQTYAYEKGVICESPQTGAWLGGPRPDPAIDKWSAALGRRLLTPSGFAQTEMRQTNGGILIFPDGLVGATGNQTAGGSQPLFELPPNKVPTAVALTSYNEFALVTVWDTEALAGQVAVFALRADSPPAFSIPYFALPNEAGFQAIHFMGFVDLPEIAAPTAIAVSGNNGSTPGGHAIGNEFRELATDPALRQAFARNDGERWVADSGQAVVLSRWEDKVTFIDMRPLFQFVRAAYFTSSERFREASAQDAWPYTFDNTPEATPVVVTTLRTPRPTVARVGNQIGAFPEGLQNNLVTFVANVDGEIRAFDVTAFSEEQRPVPAGRIRELAKVQAGRNITSMTAGGSGSYNRGVVIASRGDAAVEWIELQSDGLIVARRLVDVRFSDPVVADLSDRGPVVTIGDFSARKLLSFRHGPTEDNAGKPPANYGCGEGGADTRCDRFEFGGELDVPGAVFYLATSNVN